MIANVTIDSLLGAIPFIGDLFDISFKTNARNVRLYREALTGERRAQRDWGFLALVFFVLVVVVVIPVLALIWLLRRLTAS